ncbi:hypothetical protein ACE7GA_07775 [Roseomonas sp. CCTCC AB2023176]|uniref:hypothetical protein n=1 Tax=Roseomonas sp. CCTCC AB2023176 TaxID=3342640 RepID=UPI0035E2B147
MRARSILATVALLAGAAVGATALIPEQASGQVTQVAASTPAPANALRAPSSFDGIADARQRSVALFTEAGRVLQHPRCVNCHPAGDRPLQTDRMQLHQPVVLRGAANHGMPGMACNTCHGPANFDPARVPGHPEWHLAPRSMAWQGRSLGQICEQIKDTGRNGGKDMAALLHHMAEDSLVGWGWNPGPGREPAPGTRHPGRIRRHPARLGRDRGALPRAVTGQGGRDHPIPVAPSSTVRTRRISASLL